MTKYVALLRGIAPMNPNMHNQKLRGVLEALGFTKVASVISSGNIVFESSLRSTAKLEAIIEPAWPNKLCFTSTTIVRSLGELEALVKTNPFYGYTHSSKTSLNVTFLKHAPKEHPTPEGRGFTVTHVLDRELCIIVDTTAEKTTDYMAKAESIYGKQITTRTWKTVERIITKMQS